VADIQALKDELDEMGERLALDPNSSAEILRFLYRWKTLQAAVAEERSARAPTETTQPRTGSVPPPKDKQQSDYNAKREIILGAVRQALVELNSTEPVRTGIIFDMLPNEIAKTIPGLEPKSNLSAMIHNSKKFISYGRAGWMLPEAISGAVRMPVSKQVEDDGTQGH
jgi:hypothetical protein